MNVRTAQGLARQLTAETTGISNALKRAMERPDLDTGELADVARRIGSVVEGTSRLDDALAKVLAFGQKGYPSSAHEGARLARRSYVANALSQLNGAYRDALHGVAHTGVAETTARTHLRFASNELNDAAATLRGLRNLTRALPYIKLPQ